MQGFCLAMQHNKQIKSLAPLAGTQTRGLTRFARDFSPRVSAPYLGVMCQSDITQLNIYEFRDIAKKALWAAVIFYLKLLIIFFPLSLFMHWPENTDFSVDLLSKILLVFVQSPLFAIMPCILFFLFLFIGIAGKRTNQ